MPSPPRAWPVPSYASAAFRERVRAWYAAVAEVVRPHLAPGGPVVAIGVDNEAQMFFRLGAYDHDYHPDAVAAFRAATGHAEAPVAWSAGDAARCAAWVRWKDRYVADALGAFGAMLGDAGLAGVARFHNLPPGHHGHYEVRALQDAIGGPVGIDAYTPRAEFGELRRRALAIVGNARPVPIAFEVGVGFFPWFPPLDPAGNDDPHRERDHLLTLLAAGVRGFNLFMAVERDRYYGAAVSATGVVEPHAGWIAPLLTALADVDWARLRRAAPIALVDVRADARFGIASSSVDPVTPVVTEMLGLGPGGHAELGEDAGAVLARRWHAAIVRALELAQVAYVIVEESIPEDELGAFAAVIVPTIDRVDRALWQRVRAAAEARRTVLVIGPGTPTRDELDRPLDAPPPRRVGRLTPGSLEDLPGLAADLAGLAGDHADAWTIERPEDVRCFAHTDERGAARAVFVASDTDRAVQATLLTGDGATALRDPFTGERIRIAAGKATVALPARGVRMLVVE
ncbi:MAG: hypothetical protein KIT31_02915 [Deltaproteobacteria bacterium]|nr:hypothetical protein [Deltaproteobacteria bacterium]